MTLGSKPWALAPVDDVFLGFFFGAPCGTLSSPLMEPRIRKFSGVCAQLRRARKGCGLKV